MGNRDKGLVAWRSCPQERISKPVIPDATPAKISLSVDWTVKLQQFGVNVCQQIRWGGKEAAAMPIQRCDYQENSTSLPAITVPTRLLKTPTPTPGINQKGGGSREARRSAAIDDITSRNPPKTLLGTRMGAAISASDRHNKGSSPAINTQPGKGSALHTTNLKGNETISQALQVILNLNEIITRQFTLIKLGVIHISSGS